MEGLRIREHSDAVVDVNVRDGRPGGRPNVAAPARSGRNVDIALFRFSTPPRVARCTSAPQRDSSRT
jgi:hypothetical protein